MGAVRFTEGEKVGVVGSAPGSGSRDRGLRVVRDGDGAGNVQPDGDGVRDGVSGDREFRGAVTVAGRPVGRKGREAAMTKRQQKLHWRLSHLADLLVVVLLIGIILRVSGVL